MSIFGYIRQAIQDLRINPMRAFLSILWLVIGVLSVTVMVSLWEWLKDQVLWEMEGVATNTVTVVAWTSFNPFAPSRSADIPGFTDSDIVFFRDAMWFVTKVTPVTELYDSEVMVKGKQVEVRIVAGDKEYINIEGFDIVAGRTLIDQDIRSYNNVVLVDETFVKDYFNISPKQALGEEIIINWQYFNIVWVIDAQWFGPIDIKVAVIPISTAQQKITSDPFYQYLVFEIDELLPASEAVKLMKYTLLKWQWVSHMDDALFQVWSTETMVAQINNISAMLQFALAGIGAVALLVGGIGIMNIMLVSVTERTREIGIRKAVGAKYRDILTQFLTESAVLGLIGCVIGVLLSWWIIFGLQQLKVPALLNAKTLIIAVIFSLWTGIIFWVWPARKAAKMKPIDALRFE